MAKKASEFATTAFQKSSNDMELEIGLPASKARKKANTNMISIMEKAHGVDGQAPTLNAIQIRAYRIHEKHGAVYGAYTLDDWLEAERELNEELRGSRKKEK